MQRPSWDDYFLKIAETAAERGTCPRRKVGAVIVRDKQILSTGYNGSVRGLPHCTDVGCLIIEEGGGCQRVVHAEINSILQAANHGVCISGATIYTTMSPCWDCFKAIVNGGINRIVYLVEYRTVDLQKKFAASCGVSFEHLGTEKYHGGENVSGRGSEGT